MINVFLKVILGKLFFQISQKLSEFNLRLSFYSLTVIQTCF